MGASYLNRHERSGCFAAVDIATLKIVRIILQPVHVL